MAKTKYTSIATKAPTGLSVSRDKSSFTFSWNIGDSNYSDGQQLYYNVNGKRIWGAQAIGKTSTSRTVTINLNDIKNIEFGVRGNRGKYTTKKKKKKYYYEPTWSSWAKKTYTMKLPPLPTVSYSLDSNNANAGTFSWEISNTDDTGNNAYLKYEWESILVSKWNSSSAPTTWSNAGSIDGRLEKGSGTTTSYSWYKKEDSAFFNDPEYSVSRWFRVRSVGSAGPTAWRYTHHVYAMPKQAYEVSASVIPKAGDSGYTVVAEWTAPESIPYPIEQDVINYAIIKPKTVSTVKGNTVVTTMDYPSESASWTSVNTISDTAGKDAFTFSIPEILDDDECIFVKIDTKYDSHTTNGIPVLAKDGMGHLPDPVVNSITPNPSTHRISLNVSNTSDLTASFVAVYFRFEETQEVYQTIGVVKKSESEITIQCPDWTGKRFSIGVQAFIADYSPAARSSEGVIDYTIENIKMKSNIVWDEGQVPMPPTVYDLVAINQKNNSNAIRVTWEWTWTEANKAEISWADHEDAWESTDGPQTYEVNNLYAAAWNIAGVSVGTWYVRVRLIKEDGDTVRYGLYSDTKSIKLSSAPAIPSLVLSDGVVAEDGEVTCYWAYVTTDGTAQMQADICEAEYDATTGKYTYGDIIAKTNSAQHVSIPIIERGWHSGETHYLAVRVTSASGETSQGWSVPAPIRIADPLTVEITSTSLVNDSLTGIDYLTSLPLSFTVNSNGAASSITIMLERAKDFRMRRPDESMFDGYAGEVVATKTVTGDGNYEFTLDDLVGHLDERAAYKIIAVAKDSYGQNAESATNEEADPRGYFEVKWNHQAVVPSAEVEIDDIHNVAILTPKLPEGYTAQAGDVCDIYRLSTDPPELIYENAAFGTKYVDPYPALGDFGGHRFVFKTANGDYTTEDNHIAWHDTTEDDSDILDLFTTLIDYNGEQISLPYNISLSNRWAKDFQQTSYLGGSIQGDWNPGVSRTGSVSTVGIVDAGTEYEDEHDGTIEAVRRLANYAGICHVRTPDGSSFSANINVSEDREEKMVNKLAKYSLEITRVDAEQLDGITYELWQEMINEEE